MHFSHPVMLQIDPSHALERMLAPLGLDRVALVAALTDRRAEMAHNLSKLVHEYLALRLKALDERVTSLRYTSIIYINNIYPISVCLRLQVQLLADVEAAVGGRQQEVLNEKKDMLYSRLHFALGRQDR